MANQVPFFLTGANAKILLNNRTVAFATDVSYRVSVKHASPRVLGKYEVEVHQPVAYDVSGSLTVIRYARGLKDFMKEKGYQAPSDVSQNGNGIGSFKLGHITEVAGAIGLPTTEGQFDKRANEAFNPSRMYQSSMFDIEIRQKLPTGEEVQVVRLRDCRIEEGSFSMNKKGAAIQTYTFKARYADDDTFIARKSGVGQELS